MVLRLQEKDLMWKLFARIQLIQEQWQALQPMHHFYLLWSGLVVKDQVFICVNFSLDIFMKKVFIIEIWKYTGYCILSLSRSTTIHYICQYISFTSWMEILCQSNNMNIIRSVKWRLMYWGLHDADGKMHSCGLGPGVWSL